MGIDSHIWRSHTEKGKKFENKTLEELFGKQK